MTTLTQVQADIATLPPEAQQIIFDLVAVLKNRYQLPDSKKTKSSTQEAETETPTNTYQRFLDSGLIGCVESETDLSTTYKQELAEGWAKKYDHR